MEQDKHIFQEDPNSDKIDWKEIFDNKIWLEQLMKLSGLSVKHKRILKEYYFLGKTEKEIAEGMPSETGNGTVSPQRVGILKREALEKIKKYLINKDPVSRKKFEKRIIWG